MYSIILMALGVVNILVAVILTASDKQESWDKLSTISKEFYSNSIDNMFEVYQINMALTGLFAAVVGFLLFL